MAIAVSILLFLTLTGVIAYFGYRRYARPGGIFEQLGGKAAVVMPVPGTIEDKEDGLLVRLIQFVGEKVPISPEEASLLRRDLMMAGFHSEHALLFYQAARVFGIAGLVLLGFLARGYLTANPVLSIVIPVGLGLVGYFLPSIWLDSRISKRHETLRMALPDLLDLMVVCVEAGLGLDQAMQYVSQELKNAHPDLCREFQLVNLEIRAGSRRAEALRHLADRTGEPELRKLVAVMIQTDRFGTSIADSLRTHSEFMRVRRRQEAEERANKVGVKLVFPIFFFILPSMLVVAAGPGLLQVFKYLFPLMRQAAKGGVIQ